MRLSQILIVTSRNDKVKMFPRVFVVVAILPTRLNCVLVYCGFRSLGTVEGAVTQHV